MVVQEDFTVKTIKTNTVVSTMPMQEQRLPLSNLDLLLPPLDVNMFFCYRNIHDDDDEREFEYKVSVLKKELGEALAYYYPFTGEIVYNGDGEPELLCNNGGVEFIEAFAEVELLDLNFYNPDESIEGKLVPRKKDGVLSIQVTELKCGAMVVACAFDHRVADAYSANMFWVTWAELASSKPISTTPLIRRSLLSPRSPTQDNPTLDKMYVSISSLPPPNPSQAQHVTPLVTRVYHVNDDQLRHLQSLAKDTLVDGGDTTKKWTSRVVSFGAFLWQMIASHACQLEEENLDKIAKMGIVVDGRTRLSHGETKDKVKDFASYFGNVLSIAYGEATCRHIKEKSMHGLADLVHDFMKEVITKDHFLDLVDWVEVNRPELAMTRIYCTNDGDGPAFVLSSGLGFPILDVDFGWGKPTFGSYHFPWGGSCGYVMPMPSPSKNGDWIVYMHLYEELLDFLEDEAPNVFKPFTLDLIRT